MVDGYSYHESVGLLILLHRTVSTIRIQCGDREFENRVLGYFSQLGYKRSSYNKLGVIPTVLDKSPKFEVTKKRIVCFCFKVSTCLCVCVCCACAVLCCACAVRVLCVCCACAVRVLYTPVNDIYEHASRCSQSFTHSFAS